MFFDTNNHGGCTLGRFSESQLDFDAPRRKETMETYVTVAVVAALFYFIVFPTQNVNRIAHACQDGAVLARAMFSRTATTDTQKDTFVSDDPSKNYAKLGGAQGPILVIEKVDEDGTTVPKEQLTEDDKVATVSRLKEVLATHDKCLVIMFAPWCGACHNLMPKIAESWGAHHPPLLMVNGDCMTETMMSNQEKLLPSPVEYYPMICVKDGTNTTSVSTLVEASAALASPPSSGESAPSGGGAKAVSVRRSLISDQRVQRFEPEQDGNSSRSLADPSAVNNGRLDFMDDLFD